MVLGVGNLLLSDDGLGIHVVRRLEQMQAAGQIPMDVEILDGGTLGLDLLYYLEGVSHLVIIDAVNVQKASGTLACLTGEQVPAYLTLKMSPHQVSLPDLLLAAKLRDLYPEKVVILGAQPETIETGLELSPVVAGQVDRLVEQVLEEIR